MKRKSENFDVYRAHVIIKWEKQNKTLLSNTLDRPRVVYKITLLASCVIKK